MAAAWAMPAQSARARIANYDFDDMKTDCPPIRALPSNISTNQIQQNMNEAHAFYDRVIAKVPEMVLPALVGFFTSKFMEGGPWDYKAQYRTGTPDRRNARVFRNFNFGAVLQSFDFSYYETQSIAGSAQIAICASKLGRDGSCGTGIPWMTYHIW